MPTNLSIIIYVASPIDYARYRHTAIFLEYPSSPTPTPPPALTTTTTTPTSTTTTTLTPCSPLIQIPTPVPAPFSTPTPTRTTLLEIAGGYGFFTFVETPHYALPDLPAPSSPTTSPSSTSPTPTSPPIMTVTGTGTKEIAKIIPLTSIPDSITPGSIRMAVMSTPINNGDMDWNCQNWVGDVLGRFVKKGMISEEVREMGIDLMVEGVLEARDEWLVG